MPPLSSAATRLMSIQLAADFRNGVTINAEAELYVWPRATRKELADAIQPPAADRQFARMVQIKNPRIMRPDDAGRVHS
jgi:hypothetical protein